MVSFSANVVQCSPLRFFESAVMTFSDLLSIESNKCLIDAEGFHGCMAKKRHWQEVVELVSGTA